MAAAADSGFGAGDTAILRDLLQGEDACITIEDVLTEVPLGPLFHDNGQALNRPGAFVAAPVENSSPSTKPYLRCPSSVGVVPRDEGPVMRRLRLAASAAAGVAFNHAKVQLYETRTNHIAFHADKVLDMCEDDPFVSFRLGAARRFGLRSKADLRQRHDILATSNSAIVVGPRTNRGWTHGVLPDGRPASECGEAELAWGGRSLSIVFRRAVTFWRGDGLLFGAGARFKTEEALVAAARASGPGGGAAVRRLGAPQPQLHKKILEAWGRDNKSWVSTRAELYGEIIEDSVVWERTPDMEVPPARALPPPPAAGAVDVAPKHAGAGAGWLALLWGLGIGALCLAPRLVAPPAPL